MPYNTDESVGDFAKLQLAFREITSKFGSVQELLQAFGLADMPLAQRYGILFGCVVFTLTISAVGALLMLGGSFRRIAEQAETGESTLLSAAETRQQRSLLLEQLLEGRERMIRNYEPEVVTDQPTKLVTMLINEAPDTDILASYATTTATKDAKQQTKGKSTSTEKARYIPPFYEENYIEAYRACQDRPGGTCKQSAKTQHPCRNAKLVPL